ncbi:MAG: GNAT family N-acetyltransferase [Elusimicrobiota bacterium]
MKILVEKVTRKNIRDYSKIPIAFDIKSELKCRLVDSGLGGIRLFESRTSRGKKNYDSFGGPRTWMKRFNTRNWRLFFAVKDNKYAGAAAIACKTPKVHMLADRNDIAVLWDLRIAPEYRRSGIGRALFGKVISWLRKEKLKQLRIETQTNNVAACRFYKKQGCKLAQINTLGYWGHPKVGRETMLLWHKDI